MKKNFLIIFGTRPEFLKLLPIIMELKKNNLNYRVLNTGQHLELLSDQSFFMKNIKIENLNLMKKKSNLNLSFNLIFKNVSEYLTKKEPDLVIVQGDTATSAASALAASYLNIKIAHVEAGLRTNDMNNPFPEELNRKLISVVSDYHFAPTHQSKKNLLKEGISASKIFVTGNTIVDTVRIFKKKIKNKDFKNNVFCTIHRRENFGKNFKIICKNLNDLVNKYKNLNFVFTIHPNPKIKNYVKKYLKYKNNLKLINPVDFFESLNIQANSVVIITDSGGIQEEATTLNRHCIVVRKKTERVEGIKSGKCFLVKDNFNNIKILFKKILKKKNNTNYLNKFSNVYGDGYASKKIINILKRYE